MMSIIRLILGKIILALDWLTQPKKPDLTAKQQARLNELSANLSMYQYAACPFCIKVRRSMRRLGLEIEIRDAKNDPRWHQDLSQEGGKQQVPCLRIDEEGSATWLYESSNIIDHLTELAQH